MTEAEAVPILNYTMQIEDIVFKAPQTEYTPQIAQLARAIRLACYKAVERSRKAEGKEENAS